MKKIALLIIVLLFLLGAAIFAQDEDTDADWLVPEVGDRPGGGPSDSFTFPRLHPVVKQNLEIQIKIIRLLGYSTKAAGAEKLLKQGKIIIEDNRGINTCSIDGVVTLDERWGYPWKGDLELEGMTAREALGLDEDLEEEHTLQYLLGRANLSEKAKQKSITKFRKSELPALIVGAGSLFHELVHCLQQTALERGASATAWSLTLDDYIVELMAYSKQIEFLGKLIDNLDEVYQEVFGEQIPPEARTAIMPILTYSLKESKRNFDEHQKPKWFKRLVGEPSANENLREATEKMYDQILKSLGQTPADTEVGLAEPDPTKTITEIDQELGYLKKEGDHLVFISTAWLIDLAGTYNFITNSAFKSLIKQSLGKRTNLNFIYEDGKKVIAGLEVEKGKIIKVYDDALLNPTTDLTIHRLTVADLFAADNFYQILLDARKENQIKIEHHSWWGKIKYFVYSKLILPFRKGAITKTKTDKILPVDFLQKKEDLLFSLTKKETEDLSDLYKKVYASKEDCQKECKGDHECERYYYSSLETAYRCRKKCSALGYPDTKEECQALRKHYQICEIEYVPSSEPVRYFCYQSIDKCLKDQWVNDFTAECKEACVSSGKSCVRKSMDCYGCESPGDVADKCDPPCTIDEICQGYDPDSPWMHIPPYSKYECRKWRCPEGSWRGIDPSCPSDSPCAVNEDCLPIVRSYISYASYYGYCWQCEAVCKLGSYTLANSKKCDKDCGQSCISDKDLVIEGAARSSTLCYICPVIEGKKPCGDTPHGQCEIIKPYYCDNGKLIPKCSICGCKEDSILGKYKCDEKTGECLTISSVCGDGNQEFPPEECDPPGSTGVCLDGKIRICDEVCKWKTGRCDKTNCPAECEAEETKCDFTKTIHCDKNTCKWDNNPVCVKDKCGAGCANDADCPEGKACDLTICGCKDIPTTAVTPICTETSEWLEGHTLQMNYLTVKVDSQTYKFAQFACADEYDYYKVAWCGKVKSISKEKIADEDYVISLFYEKPEPCPPCDPGMVSAGCQKIKGESGVEHGSCFCVSADQ